MPIMAIMVLLACGFTSCNSKHKGFKKDDTGFYYKFHINNDTAASGEICAARSNRSHSPLPPM